MACSRWVNLRPGVAAVDAKYAISNADSPDHRHYLTCYEEVPPTMMLTNKYGPSDRLSSESNSTCGVADRDAPCQPRF
jgi:hypothetical protein